MFDFHVHSDFSADSDQNIKELIDYAVSKKMTDIAITDHIDYGYDFENMIFEFNVDDHRCMFETLKREYADSIKIRRGVEIGLQPHVLDDCQKLIREEDFDFVIASVHQCEKKNFYIDFFEGRSAEDSLGAYLDEMKLMIENFTEFNVIGHIDFLKRYSVEVSKTDHRLFSDKYEQIMKTLIGRDQGIEINTSGLRQGFGVPFPDFKLLELYWELGGRIITLGSDAHVKEDLCSGFETVRSEIKAIGFKNLFLFDKMKPVEVNIDSVIFNDKL